MLSVHHQHTDMATQVGHTVMGFGRFREKTYSEVATHHTGYVRWAKEQHDASPQMQAFQRYLVLRNSIAAQEKVHTASVCRIA